MQTGNQQCLPQLCYWIWNSDFLSRKYNSAWLDFCKDKINIVYKILYTVSGALKQLCLLCRKEILDVFSFFTKFILLRMTIEVFLNLVPNCFPLLSLFYPGPRCKHPCLNSPASWGAPPLAVGQIPLQAQDQCYALLFASPTIASCQDGFLYSPWSHTLHRCFVKAQSAISPT